MRKHLIWLGTVMIFSMILSACAAGVPNTGQGSATQGSAQGAGATQTAGAMMMAQETGTSSAMMMAQETSTSAAMMHTTPTGEMMAGSATPAAMMHGSATPGAMMSESATPDAMMMHTTPTGSAMMQATPGGSAMASWLSAPLTDTHSKSFTLSDYKGKVVLVELMAVWCTTCKAQQGQIQALHSKLGMPANLVTVSLDIDPNEDAATLSKYVSTNPFDWSFAVASKTSAQEIGKLYGDQFLNPPSAPVLIVDAHGQVHPLPFGVKSAADLQKQIEPYLKGAM